jgi:hypothetical protein
MAVLAATVGMLFAAPAAHAFIFWSSYDSNSSKIGRANLDGTDYRPSLVSGIYYGQGVATDGSHVYWTSTGGGPGGYARIGRANLDGTSPSHGFYDVGWPQGLFDVKAVDGQIFWLKGSFSGMNGQEIGRTDAAGGQSGFQVGTGTEIHGFDVENGYAYWSEGDYIVRAALSNPGAPDRTWLHVGPDLQAAAVAVEGDHVYWTEIEPDTPEPYYGDYGTSIGRAPIAEPTAVLHGLVNGIRVRLDSGLDVEGEYIYWTNMADPSLPYPQNIPGYVGRATIGGSQFDPKFIGPLGATSEPRRLDVTDAAPVTPPQYFPPPAAPIPPPQYIPRSTPQVSSLSTRHKTFTYTSGTTPVRARASAAKKVPSGTVFSYQLDDDAPVTIEMKRLKAGRKVGKSCKPRRKANATKKKCDLVEHKLWRSGKKGANKVPYTGKVKGKVLKPGKYKAVFTATGPGGSRSASVSFTFVR